MRAKAVLNMARVRVETILQAIAELTPEEQCALKQSSSPVIPAPAHASYPALEQVDRLRDEALAYMKANNIPFTTAGDLVHEVRREREAELLRAPIEEIPRMTQSTIPIERVCIDASLVLHRLPPYEQGAVIMTMFADWKQRQAQLIGPPLRCSEVTSTHRFRVIQKKPAGAVGDATHAVSNQSPIRGLDVQDLHIDAWDWRNSISVHAHMTCCI
jgi:hypothetical protein